MFEPAKAFRALSDRKRLRIVGLLSGREVCVCELMSALRMAQPTVSRHLAYLRGAGLVRDRREGRWRHYSLAKPSGAVHRRLLDAVRACAAAEPDCGADRKRLGKGRVCA